MQEKDNEINFLKNELKQVRRNLDEMTKEMGKQSVELKSKPDQGIVEEMG